MEGFLHVLAWDRVERSLELCEAVERVTWAECDWKLVRSFVVTPASRLHGAVSEGQGS